MVTHIDYDCLVQEALRHVVKEALKIVQKGMPGQHEFYITFQTDFEGVEVPDFLSSQYPEEMTILLQQDFWDLKVTDDYFSVLLVFDTIAHTLKIPFKAITGFVDPSDDFGLKFTADFVSKELRGMSAEEDEEGYDEENGQESPHDSNGTVKDSNIISFDRFRKK